MKSLVTGGAGFIGSNLVDKLVELGHEVICIDNESSECHDNFYWNSNANNFKYNICDFDLIAPLVEGVDNIFHVASDARIQPSILKPKMSIENNIIGTTNMLELARIAKVKKFIYSSTSSAYGKISDIPNIETQPANPLTPYSASKVFGENLCNIYFQLYGIETISLRYFNVYGTRQPLKGKYAPVIGLFLKQFQQDLPLTVVGDGSQKRDFTHISDVVDANILAFSKDRSSIYGKVCNIGFGRNYSILEIARMISSKIDFIENRVGEVDETLASNERFREAFGWEPKVSLDYWLSEAKENQK